MAEEFYRVDLKDPDTLRSVLDAYLRLKVCPVGGEHRPPLLYPTTVEIMLPDGSSMTRWGTVIRYTGAKGFLVQFDGPLDLATLEDLAKPSAAAQVTDDAMFVPSADFEPDPDFVPESTSQAAGRQSTSEPEPEPEPEPQSVAEVVEDSSNLDAWTELSDPARDPVSGPMVDAFVAGANSDALPEVPDDSSTFLNDRTTAHEADDDILDELVDHAAIEADAETASEEIDPIADDSILNDLVDHAAIEADSETASEKSDPFADDGILNDLVDNAAIEADVETTSEGVDAETNSEGVDAETNSEGVDPFADLLDDLEDSGEPGPVVEDFVDEGIPEGWTSTGEHTIPPDDEEIPVEQDDVEPTSSGVEPESADADPNSGQPEARLNSQASRLNSTEMSSVYKQIETMSPSEKQRLARSGNRITRGLLAKDRNKNVHQFVFRNPKIAVEEVVEYSKLPGLSKDAIRIIASSRTWLANRQVVLGLVRNPGTPVNLLPGLVQRLGPQQWQVLSKSGDVRPQVSSLAKKLLLASRR